MVNKAKKRSLSESNTAEKAAAHQVNEVNKKKKAENKVAIQNGQTMENVKSPKRNNAAKKKQGKEAAKDMASPQTSPQKEKGPVNKNKPQTTANEEKSTNKSSERKLKQLKNRQAFREKRKLRRAEIGNAFSVQVNMTAEQINARIEEIKSRDTLSKTAKRKLSILKKRLRALESGESPEQNTKTVKQTKDTGNKNTAASKKMQKTNTKLEIDNKKNKLEAVKGKGVQNDGPNKKMKANAKDTATNKKAKQGSLLLIKKKEEEDEDDEDDEDDEEEEEVDDEEVSEDDEDLEEEEEEDDDEDEEEEDDDDDDDDDDDEEEEEEEEEEITPTKGQKGEAKMKLGLKAQNDKQAKQASGEEDMGKDQKKRYVLFVSNIPYSATTDEIKKHFLTKVSEVTDVRIPLKPGTKTPRGFAYVQFPNSTEFEKALSLHGSFIKDRRITVQYPAAGKNADNKKNIAKNHKLHALQKQGKLAGSHNKNQKSGGNKGKPNAGAMKT